MIISLFLFYSYTISGYFGPFISVSIAENKSYTLITPSPFQSPLPGYAGGYMTLVETMMPIHIPIIRIKTSNIVEYILVFPRIILTPLI